MEGGVAYFTDNPNDFSNGNPSGAVGTKYVMSRYLPPDLKLGGYAEADKFSTDELIQQGYDGLKLEKDGSTWYEIFNPNEKLLTEAQIVNNKGGGTKIEANVPKKGGVKMMEGLVPKAHADSPEDYPPIQNAFKYMEPKIGAKIKYIASGTLSNNFMGGPGYEFIDDKGRFWRFTDKGKTTAEQYPMPTEDWDIFGWQKVVDKVKRTK